MHVHHTVLVVSPLLSLMIDQVESLRKCGVSATILSGNEGVYWLRMNLKRHCLYTRVVGVGPSYDRINEL